MTRTLRKRDYEALARFRRALREFLIFTEEGARAAGVTPHQHQLLLAVKGQPGRSWATISELAAALQVRHHTVVGLVDRSERSDLVVRAKSDVDRRQVRVKLSRRGEGILKRLSSRNLAELGRLRRSRLLWLTR